MHGHLWTSSCDLLGAPWVNKLHLHFTFTFTYNALSCHWSHWAVRSSDDLDVFEVEVQDIQQQDEYEIDSDKEIVDDEVGFEVVSETCMTRGPFLDAPGNYGPVKLFCFPSQMGVSYGLKIVQ